MSEPLPAGLRSRAVDNGNGLNVYLLEAGDADAPLLLLLHGFPELAYSWRRIMPALAAAGYYVVAPDQRGYGRTTGWDGDYDGDLASFRMLNLTRDALGLVYALGRRSAAAVIGHDFGSPVAAYCALLRPDVFRAAALMSAPFGGPPPLGRSGSFAPDAVHADLAALTPPRKHYQWYYSTRDADAEMRAGGRDFLRAYYHMKSADWADNRPRPLSGWNAPALAELPDYYIMPLDAGMSDAVAAALPAPAQIAGCGWLPDDELSVYHEAFQRNGFQGGLQWYRCATEPRFVDELRLFAGRTIDVPALFIAGLQDWGVYQKPGDFEAMRERVCSDLRGCHLIDGAGHWVQQEQPDEVAERLREFLATLSG